MNNKDSDINALTYEFSNIPKMVMTLDLFKTNFKIIKTICHTTKKGAFIISDKSNIKYFLKVKLIDFLNENEIDIYKKLKKYPHKNVNAIKFIYQTNKFLLVISEYLDGYVLSEQLCRSLYDENLFDIFEGVVEGINHLHSLNVIHCDMKPENIIISVKKIKENIVCIPIIVDFDFCRLEEYCKVINFYGTHGYMAPEIASGTVMKKSDVWEVAMTFYNFIFGNDYVVEDDDAKIVFPDMNLVKSYNGKHKKILSVMENMLDTNYDIRPNAKNVLDVVSK